MFNPFACATSIENDLLSYITSSLPIGNHPTQVKLGEEFYREWKTNLFKGPFVEALPKYRTVGCLAEWFASSPSLTGAERNFSTVLGRSAGLNWNDAGSRSTVRDRVWSEHPAEEQAERSETSARRLWTQPLYSHQWDALRTVVEKHRSIVVATGTGSGKTECYLLPLLYLLITEDASVRAQSGVRAILLFPMNALVEDQMRRLRKLLFWVNLASSTLSSTAPEKLRRQITFGRYTGDTPVDDADPERPQPPDHIRELGEKVTRAEMQQEPPDILVTNFSMLELALLRSQDQALLKNPAVFKMLVLDEAHTYSGTVGAEVAMLLRRLRAFLEGKSGGTLQTPVFVGTSATLGSGPDAKERMATFASGLFGVAFGTNQVLQGDTLPVAVSTARPERSRVRDLAAELSNFADRSPALLQLLGGQLVVDDVPDWESKVAEDLEELAVLLDGCWGGVERDTRDFEALSRDPEGRCRDLLGRICQASAAMGSLINLIQDSDTACLDLEQLTLDYFGIVDRSDPFLPVASRAQSVLLTIMANASVSGRTLFPLRFHHFVSEQKEGLLCMNPRCNRADTVDGGTDGWWSRLFVSHRTTCPSCNSVVFPLVICRKCGFSYLEAWREPHGHLFLPEREEPEAQMFRLLFRPTSQLTESAEELDARQRALCLMCGHWFESAATQTGREAQAAHPARCTNARIVEVFEWSKDQADFEMLECKMCEQHWYSDREVVTGPAVSPYAAATIFLEDLAAHVAPAQSRSKLISFSDTRQQAAKLAERLHKSNRDYVFRQLIYHVLASAGSLLKTVELFDRLFKEVRDDERKRQLFIDDPLSLHNNRVLEQSLADLLFREAVSAYYTLESLGLVEVQYSPLLSALAQRLTFSPFWRRCIPDEEKSSFVALVLDWGLRFRQCASSAVKAIPYEIASLQRWNIFPKRVTGPQYGQNDQIDIAFFLARADKRNPLFNFMDRLNERYQTRHSVWTVDRQEFNNLLDGLWSAIFSDQRFLTTGTSGPEATREFIATRPREPDYATLQLNLNALLWRKTIDTGKISRCDSCGRLSHYSLGGVCPVRWCGGRLVEVSQPEIDRQFSPSRHYRRLIRERDLQPLSVEEHTAEIANPRRLEIERLFKRDDEGSIDVISGSTTF
jgi:hypothetical protein